MKEASDREISKIWITGKSSFTIVIPKRFVKELGLSSHDHVVIEKQLDAILVKKLGSI